MNDTVDPRVAFFDACAARWQDDTSVPARLAALRDRLPLAPGQDVLEVGCGTGQISAWLAEQVRPGRVVAVDFAAEMVSRARQRNPGIEIRRADVCEERCGEGCFDVAWCLNVFPHFRDARAALRNLRAALRPGGHLLILHLNGWRAINEIHTQVGGAVAHDHLPPPGAWDDLLGGCGLRRTSLTDEPDFFLLHARVDTGLNPAKQMT